jgi:hypothetical protein
MKQFALPGLLAAALAVTVYAQQPTATSGQQGMGHEGMDMGGQDTPAQKPAAKPAAKPRTRPAGDTGGVQGHTAPKPQDVKADEATAPGGELTLGTVRLNRGVKADGKPLAAGTYTVRVTPEEAKPDVKGQTEKLERWAEFVQRGQVKGREVVTIVPQNEIAKVAKDPAPRPNGSKVEMLKGNEYVRVWINKGGNHYLVYLPPA